jgi:hypothetical protein
LKEETEKHTSLKKITKSGESLGSRLIFQTPNSWNSKLELNREAQFLTNWGWERKEGKRNKIADIKPEVYWPYTSSKNGEVVETIRMSS